MQTNAKACSETQLNQLADRAKGISSRFLYPHLIIYPVDVSNNTFLATWKLEKHQGKCHKRSTQHSFLHDLQVQ